MSDERVAPEWVLDEIRHAIVQGEIALSRAITRGRLVLGGEQAAMAAIEASGISGGLRVLRAMYAKLGGGCDGQEAGREGEGADVVEEGVRETDAGSAGSA